MNQGVGLGSRSNELRVSG